MMQLVGEILIAVLVVGGALGAVIVGIALLRQPDVYSRMNSMGPATALGFPMVILGVFLAYWFRDGFSVALLLKALATVGAAVVVSSVATNVLARAAYLSGAPVDPRTVPNELAAEEEDQPKEPS